MSECELASCQCSSMIAAAPSHASAQLTVVVRGQVCRCGVAAAWEGRDRGVALTWLRQTPLVQPAVRTALTLPSPTTNATSHNIR